MKIISLNIYGGRVFDPLMDFIERHADSTDVFCFQEVLKANVEGLPIMSRDARTNIYQEIEKRLPDFVGYFGNQQKGFDNIEETEHDLDFGLATFVKKGIEVTGQDHFFIYRAENTLQGEDYSTLGSSSLVLHVKDADRDLSIYNLHGTSEPAHKRDTEDRLNQSRKLLAHANSQEGEKIVVGDFNMFPDTESIKMFEDEGFRNLINDFDIKTTRGQMNKTLHPEFEHGKYGWQEFADYTFVSLGIKVKAFEVPDEPISDHLPMILEIK